MRETVLKHLQENNFDEIIKVFKDNKIFNGLLEDDIFKLIFFQNFTDQLFSQDDLEITYPAFLYQCHKSKDYVFELNQNDTEKVLKFLIDKTKHYNYAKELPNYSLSIQIINDYQLNLKTQSEKSEKLAKKHRDFEIVEKYSNNTESLIKSIFNSPQEKEFYLACRNVFENQLIFPNMSLTNLFNQEIVKQKFSDFYSFYLKSSIDFVIVDENTFIPILFFELDSKTYHSDQNAKKRDEIKNLLVTELGNSLIRITKKTGSEGIEEYVNFLKIIKEEKNIC